MRFWPQKWKFSRKADDTWSVFRDYLDGVYGKSNSNVAVNWQTALQADTALACARVISEGIAQVPLKLFRGKAGGGADVASDHPLYDLLHTKVNDWQTSYDWREQAGLHLVFAGNAYASKVVVAGKVVELLPWEPNQITIERKGYELLYTITLADGKKQTVPASEMLHLRGPSWNGYQGLDGVKLLREAIGLAIATERHGARLFSNGAQPGGIITTEQNLSPEQRTLLRQSWQETHGGNDNAFKTAILWGGLKWSSMAQHNDDAQFLETRAFQVESVCRGFRVLPVMVGHADKAATYASAEQMFLAHVVHTMSPWYARIEQQLNTQLLTEADRKAGLYSKFVAAGLMRGAAKDRADFYTKMYGIGALNPNEIRELEDRNPYPEGNEFRVPLNMVDPAAEPVPPPVAPPKDDEELPKMMAAVADLKATLLARPAPASEINVKAGDVHVTMPDVRLTNEVPKQDAPHVDVHVPAQAAPHITVQPSEVKVDVAAPVVNLEATLRTPDHMTMDITSMPTRETSSGVERDAKGNIIATTQIESDKQ